MLSAGLRLDIRPTEFFGAGYLARAQRPRERIDLTMFTSLMVRPAFSPRPIGVVAERR